MMKKLLLVSLLTLFSVHTFFADSAITIEYGAADEGEELPIEKVYFFDQEIPHVSLADILDPTISHGGWPVNIKKAWEHKNSSYTSWQRFFIAQLMIYFVTAGGYIKQYINDDDVVSFNNTAFMKGVVKKIDEIGSNKIKIAGASLLGALALFPFIRYFKFFSLHTIDFHYPCETIDNRIVVFRKKTYSHSIGNTIYYTITSPLGYMTLDEKEKEFAEVEWAFRCMNLSFLTTTLCGGGLLWAFNR